MGSKQLSCSVLPLSPAVPRLGFLLRLLLLHACIMYVCECTPQGTHVEVGDIFVVWALSIFPWAQGPSSDCQPGSSQWPETGAPQDPHSVPVSCLAWATISSITNTLSGQCYFLETSQPEFR